MKSSIPNAIEIDKDQTFLHTLLVSSVDTDTAIDSVQTNQHSKALPNIILLFKPMLQWCAFGFCTFLLAF
jgi:hypothetical protein